LNRANNHKDGRIVKVYPGDSIEIGNYKNDLHHGQCIVIDNEGEKCIPSFLKAEQHGNSYFIDTDNTLTRIDVYEKGELVDVDESPVQGQPYTTLRNVAVAMQPR
jgi:hypothetical protein